VRGWTFRSVLLLLLFQPSVVWGAEALQCPDGWTQQGSAREYVPETLFDYMDGNAEGYLIYGFQKMDGISCKKAGLQLIVDVSLMDSPESAWGLFASNRDPRRPVSDIGMAGQVLDNRAIFAKGSRFVEFSVAPTGDHHDLLSRLAKAWAARFTGDTTPPAALGWFPKAGLKPESIRLIPSSVLGVSQLRRGFVADYDSGMRAFIVPEESAESARQVMQELSKRFGAGESAHVADESFLTSDRYLGQMCIFRKGAKVAGVVKAESPAQATDLATELARQIP
jgi:hypothetical protein